ncbi:unnamed protein product [Brachionus calyciflorus]|uniref:DUF5745 domain-containing protein n=1 Tax=Brachionus calyciflorus TaxID=104777 RepID=A0A813T2L7_9BILA|nr:unnamed protein product [Brachionus calyciflorus]
MSTNSDQKNETLKSLSSKTKIIKERIINSVNELLKTCKSDPNQSISSISIPNEITCIKQIKSNLFVYFYEQICSTELIDKKWPCKNQEDEIHNLQSVIDSLSLDVLHEDLSHLTAESILGLGSNNRRDLTSLEYLLDILKTTQEWITSRLENSEYCEPIISFEENNTNQKHELVNQNNLNEKYSQVERKMEETIKLTQEAIKEHSINYKQDNNVDDGYDDDIFKKYMQQKELEFKFKNSSNLVVSDRETLKSSSGNSSLNDALNSSMDSSSMNEMFNLAINLNNQQQKQVKFQIDSRTRSHSPEIRYNKEDNISRSSRRKIAHCKSPTIQTRHNEIEMIKNNLAQSLDLNSDKIERLMNLIYSEDYEDAQAMMLNSLKSIKKKSDLTNDLYLNAHDGAKLFKSKLIPSERSRSKGVLLPRSKSLVKINKKRSSSLNNNLNKNDDACKKRWHSAVKKSLELSKDPAKKFYSRYVIGEDGILSSLLEEFPYLYTSPETIHYLWSRHAKQIETLSKTQKDLDAKYLSKNSADNNLAENYLKEANRKQEILMNIMRKELEHIERQQDMKRKNLVENSLKAKTREQRFQTAKVKRYFEEFRIQQKAKMLKQKTSEELIFKKLFNETLKIQKERMLELKKYAKEKNEINLKQQINQIKSIENFYKNKFDLLNEHIKKEKEETELRDNSQHLILNKMKNQVKHKLETDIRDLQDQMYRDKDFLHWRQLDADRLKQDIAKASYFRPAVVSLNSFNN